MSRAIRNCSMCSATRSLATASARNSIQYVSGLAKDVPNVCKSVLYHDSLFYLLTRLLRYENSPTQESKRRWTWIVPPWMNVSRFTPCRFFRNSFDYFKLVSLSIFIELDGIWMANGIRFEFQGNVTIQSVFQLKNSESNASIARHALLRISTRPAPRCSTMQCATAKRVITESPCPGLTRRCSAPKVHCAKLLSNFCSLIYDTYFD